MMADEIHTPHLQKNTAKWQLALAFNHSLTRLLLAAAAAVDKGFGFGERRKTGLVV